MSKNANRGTIYLINGIGTDIGKTFFATKLIESVRQEGRSVLALKPIISGLDEDNFAISDNALLIRSAHYKSNDSKGNITFEEVKSISRYALSAPLSPNIAAKIEGVSVIYDNILQFCIEKINRHHSSSPANAVCVVEFAGGIMSPINDSKTMLDLAHDLQIYFQKKNSDESKIDIRQIILTSDYLGSISHALTAINAMKTNGLHNIEIVMNKLSKEPVYQSSTNISKLLDETIEKFSGYKVRNIQDYINSTVIKSSQGH